MENQKPRYELDPNMGVPGQVLLRLFGFTADPVVIKIEHISKDFEPALQANPITSIWNKETIDRLRALGAMVEQDLTEALAGLALINKKRLSREKKVAEIDFTIKVFICSILSGATVPFAASYTSYKAPSGRIASVGLATGEQGFNVAAFYSKDGDYEKILFQPSVNGSIIVEPLSKFLTEDGTVDQIKLINRLKQLSIEAGSFPDDYVATNYQKEEK